MHEWTPKDGTWSWWEGSNGTSLASPVSHTSPSETTGFQQGPAVSKADQNRPPASTGTDGHRAPGTAGRHLSCKHPTKPCVSAGGAHNGESKWAITSLPRPASRTTAPAPRRTGLPHRKSQPLLLVALPHHHHTSAGAVKSSAKCAQKASSLLPFRTVPGPVGPPTQSYRSAP